MTTGVKGSTDHEKVLQEVFDTSVMGILNQGKPSMNDTGSCLYRGPDNCKCAAGHLIPDDKYNKKFEGKSVYHDVWKAMGIGPRHTKRKRLISRLQTAHDIQANNMFGMKSETEAEKNKQFQIWFCQSVIGLAKEYNLDYSKVEVFLKGLKTNAS